MKESNPKNLKLISTLGEARYNRDLTFVNYIKQGLDNLCKFDNVIDKNNRSEIDSSVYYWSDDEYSRLIATFENISYRCNADLRDIAISIIKRFEGKYLICTETEEFLITTTDNPNKDSYNIDEYLDKINSTLNNEGLALLQDSGYIGDIYFVTLLGTLFYNYDDFIEGDDSFYYYDDYSPMTHFYNILSFNMLFTDDGFLTFKFSESAF